LLRGGWCWPCCWAPPRGAVTGATSRPRVGCGSVARGSAGPEDRAHGICQVPEDDHRSSVGGGKCPAVRGEGKRADDLLVPGQAAARRRSRRGVLRLIACAWGQLCGVFSPAESCWARSEPTTSHTLAGVRSRNPSGAPPDQLDSSGHLRPPAGAESRLQVTWRLSGCGRLERCRMSRAPSRRCWAD
jgi:hypothetical protein